MSYTVIQVVITRFALVVVPQATKVHPPVLLRHELNLGHSYDARTRTSLGKVFRPRL